MGKAEFSVDSSSLPGKSSVVFRCVEETNLILIHSNKLNYTKTDDGHMATLRSLGGDTAPSITSSRLVLETQYLVIHLGGKLVENGTYILDTEFTGELADDLGGFYRSEYEENGQTKYV